MDIRQLLTRVAKADFADAVGIAVSEDLLAVVHVRKRLQSVSLQSVASRSIDVPRESRTALIVDFVRAFMAEHEVDEARICLALEPNDVLLGHLQLPATATENFASVVGYELDRIFPVPAASLVTQQYWRPLGAGGERVHATVVAGMRERVEQVQGALAAVGLAPTSITALPVALNDFYGFCRGHGQRTAGLFYRHGARESMVVSSRGVMVSNVPYAQSDETRSERLWRELETLVPDAIQDDVEVVMDGDATDGAVDLTSCMPEQLYAGRNGAPTLRWHEAAAVGAALSQLGEAKVKVNLLPVELQRVEEGVGLRELGLAALVAVFAVVLAATIALKNLTIGNALAEEVESLLPRVSRVQAQEAENRKALESVTLLENPRNTSVLAYLREMTESVPNTAYLTTFRYKGDRLEVDGVATTASELIAVLERSGYFKNVEFTAPTTKYLQTQERFSLRMGLER
jgi:Tfp pilus assembly protein PilN